MYSSYLTRETFENEHDEKMTRKFSYNYQVLKRLFPEVYKLPESEIRSLVHSIYDNPKLGDELLDHLSDVINKKKPEWGEYLNPKPEEPEQTVQNNPLQPVQPKPLNTGSGFEPYKPQKSAFGFGNSGGFGNAGGLGNSSAFGLNNTNNFGTTGGLKQSQLPDLTKGMDLKHSDMVTGFGINEAKQKSMLGTGFSMPKLPKMPQFPKAPEPQIPELPQMPEISQAPQFQQPALTPYFPQTETPQYSFFYKMPTYQIATILMLYNMASKAGEALADAHIAYKHLNEMKQTGRELVKKYGSGAGADIDNYYHPLLQCQLAKISPRSRDYGLRLGYAKEIYDYNKKKSIMPMDILVDDMRKDLYNNLYGSDLGYYNPDVPCWELLDDRRTENMRKANIR